ncbi:endochitinase A-like isoform X1 [Oryza brachyantha]|uniref:endochitinase A-like isoform X1 n=1 Tax=Oryza brachyantha TaxID=4533 RepID=UPI001ADCB6AF|nr:endochitinase A-like isoform X1 [Oryza brachyantha]
MAPPRMNSSPPTSSSSSNSKSNKVTPAQVAFLVDRYLADNGFSASLAAFRSDAAHLFTKAAPVPPKGLLPLADILHDYVHLKESRLAVDSAMHAMHNLVSSYYLHHPPPTTPPSPPASSSSPPGPAPTLASPILRYTHTQTQTQTSSSSLVLHSHSHNASDATALPTSNKRKATKSAGKAASASKKTCTTSHPKGKTVACQPSTDNPDHNMLIPGSVAAQPPSALLKLPLQGSSVAKSLFRPLQSQSQSQSQAHSSPCTPQQSHSAQGRPAAYQTERPPSVLANAHAQQELPSSQCSIVSSKTVIVSPLKGAAYYAVERSYHVSSPLKSKSSSKREHVKGKLDFGTSDATPSSHEQICNHSPSSSEGEKQDEFGIDLTNFDIFDGDFSFSELLVDLDLDTEGFQCHDPSISAEVQRLDPVPRSDYVTAVPVLLGSAKPMSEDATEDINSQAGPASVTSVRAITKRIKIVSPVKGRTAP